MPEYEILVNYVQTEKTHVTRSYRVTAPCEASARRKYRNGLAEVDHDATEYGDVFDSNIDEDDIEEIREV